MRRHVCWPVVDREKSIEKCEALSLRGFVLQATGFAIKHQEGHLVDALASRGDEGRGTLR